MNREFRKGDRVVSADPKLGLGTVTLVHPGNSFRLPISVRFDNGKVAEFTRDGRISLRDVPELTLVSDANFHTVIEATVTPMKTIFKLVNESSPARFEIAVNRLLKDGWKLEGNHQAAISYSTYSKLELYTQALTKQVEI